MLPVRSWESHPILKSIEPVIRAARHVRLSQDGLDKAASRLAPEAFPVPIFTSPAPEGASPEERTDLFFVSASINFAFTDFETSEVFHVVEKGKTYSDADAMALCLRRGVERGWPVGDGSWLRRLDLDQAAKLFQGPSPIPMLERRCRILNSVGAILEERFGGRFHRYLQRFPPRAYAGGDGLVENLVRDFPSFLDERPYDGVRVSFQKRAQLLLWQLHSTFRNDGFFQLEDLEELTAFADYILPMGLELMGVLRYSDTLKATITERRILAEGCPEEVEIRAFTIWACRLLTEAINRLHSTGRQIVDPDVDAYLWFNYHESPHRHHLTRTTSY